MKIDRENKKMRLFLTPYFCQDYIMKEFISCIVKKRSVLLFSAPELFILQIIKNMTCTDSCGVLQQFCVTIVTSDWSVILQSQ